MNNDSGNCTVEDAPPDLNAEGADYLTRQAAADLLGITLTALRRRIRVGEIGTIKIGDQVLVKRASLERFLAPIQLAGGRVWERAQQRARGDNQ